MKEEVASRPLVDTINEAGVSRRSIKASDEEEEGNGMKAADEEEILRLKAALKEKEAELEEKEKFVQSIIRECEERVAKAEDALKAAMAPSPV